MDDNTIRIFTFDDEETPADTSTGFIEVYSGETKDKNIRALEVLADNGVGLLLEEDPGSETGITEDIIEEIITGVKHIKSLCFDISHEYAWYSTLSGYCEFPTTFETLYNDLKMFVKIGFSESGKFSGLGQELVESLREELENNVNNEYEDCLNLLDEFDDESMEIQDEMETELMEEVKEIVEEIKV